MRNRLSILWWVLGIYLIFSVTSAALGQAVPSESDSEADTASNDPGADTVSDDPALPQSQMTKIMDEIRAVEIRLRAHIDETYSELKTESDALHKVEIGLRNHIDRKYSGAKEENDTLRQVEIGLRNHIDEKYSEYNAAMEKLGAYIDKEIETFGKDVNDKIETFGKKVDQLQIDKLNRTIWILQWTLRGAGLLIAGLIGAFITDFYQMRKENKNLDSHALRNQSLADSFTASQQ